jgi:NADPH:quinone reductase
MLQGATAHYLTRSTFPLERGHTCLVHAAAGGAGGLIVQLAKSRGARVFGTVSTEEKAREVRALGADEAIVYTTHDFEAEVKRLTDGRGVDVVYDSVGRTTFDKSLSVLRPRGMMVLFGQSSGPVPPFDASRLNSRGSLFLTRPSLNHYLAAPDELRWRAGEVMTLVTSGALKVRVSAVYPLADAARAHRDLEGRRTTGKLLLRVK